MIAPDEALRLVLETSRTLADEEVPFEEACGRVLAAPLAAREDLPGFDNSAMDGYALRALDVAGASRSSPRNLSLVGSARAGGSAASFVGPGQAARVLTGAALPPGADSVVMQELAAPDGRGGVGILQDAEAGQHVRRRGEDIRSGGPLLERGAVLRPAEIGLLAAQGIATVRVVRRPRLAILPTGDELTRPAPGAGLRDSNGPALAAACLRWGAWARRRPAVGDDRAAIAAAAKAALAEADVLLLTGGVSVGDFDFTRPALEDLGAEVVFAGVSIKPGKPLLFALVDGKPVFGLPGNPVSAMVCAEEFVRPALERLQGRAGGTRSFHIEGRAACDYPLHSERRHYLFCRARPAEEGWRLDVLRPQGSARLGMACRADALAVAEGGPRLVKEGERLWFRWIK